VWQEAWASRPRFRPRDG